MQNRKLKISLIGLAIVSMGTIATAQTQAPQVNIAPVAVPAVASPTAVPSGQVALQQTPIVAAQPSPNPEQVLLIAPQSSNDGQSKLEEITRLRFEKAKLELKKDIAKLKMETEDIETGASKKALIGAPGLPVLNPGVAAAQVSQQPAQPSAEEIVYNSVYVSSIFGDEKNLSAEIVTSKGKVIGKVGAILPTGEVIASIKGESVVLTKGKKKRALTPSVNAGLSMPVVTSNSNQQQAQLPQGPTGGFFTPGEVLSSMTSNKAPAEQNEKRPSGL